MSRRLPERVRIDAEVAPGEPTKIVQWGLRYSDGQTLIRGGREKTEKEHAAQKPDDPCVIVTRTITVATTAWSEPEQIVLDRLRDANDDLRQAARSLRGLT